MEENAKKVILKYLEQITGDKKLTRLIVGIVSLYFTLSDKKLYVKVTDETLTVVKGKKIDEYNIEECAMKARIKNNDILTLYVTDSNDNTKSYDLSLLGYKQFQKLIEDLTIIGDKSEPITLKAE